MSSIHKRGPADIHANLTPMIDVTFLLIVFFVLVSQIVEIENVEMNLPELTDPATFVPGEEQRAVINVVPGPGGRAREYRIGTQAFPVGASGVESLTAHLAGLFRANPALRVNLRADQRTHYQWVRPALQAVPRAAGRVVEASVAPRVNLVIVRED